MATTERFEGKCWGTVLGVAVGLGVSLAPGVALAGPDLPAPRWAGTPPADTVDDAPSPRASSGEPSLDVLAVRAGAGAGIGSSGEGLRLGGVLELWPGRHLGVGFEAAMHGQTLVTVQDHTTSSARTLAPLFILRTPGPHGHLIARFGAGYADAVYTREPGLCISLSWNGSSDPCPLPRRRHYAGIAGSSAFGWAGRLSAGPAEAAVLGRFELVVDPRGNVPTTVLGTLNVEFGFGA